MAGGGPFMGRNMTEAARPEMKLRLTRAEEIARDIHLFEFRDPHGGALPAFDAGAHVTIRVPNGLLRKFSLCNDPAERDRYVVAVKREATGKGGSISLIDDAKIGMHLTASAPVNDFALARNAQHFVFVAGGIGITPILAMVRTLRKIEGKQFKLYYCTRSPEFTAFRDELSVPELASSVTIHHDDGDPARALDLRPLISERRNRAHLYCCGPLGLMHAVRDMTSAWTPTSVHMEAFSEPERVKADDHPFTVRLAKSGETITVPVGTTILEAMRAAGHEVPSSCETGTCGTCRVKLLSGDVDHRDLFLPEQERASNIMICVSRARSDEIVIDR
jgi:phthalate 4,5-dioxygenase reductase component